MTRMRLSKLLVNACKPAWNEYNFGFAIPAGIVLFSVGYFIVWSILPEEKRRRRGRRHIVN